MSKSYIRFIKNVLLDVSFPDDDQPIQVPFGTGEWHEVTRVETDGEFFNIVFPDGAIIKGVSNKVFETNQFVPIVEAPEPVEEIPFYEIAEGAKPVEVALFDGLMLGEKPIR